MFPEEVLLVLHNLVDEIAPCPPFFAQLLIGRYALDCIVNQFNLRAKKIDSHILLEQEMRRQSICQHQRRHNADVFGRVSRRIFLQQVVSFFVQVTNKFKVVIGVLEQNIEPSASDNAVIALDKGVNCRGNVFVSKDAFMRAERYVERSGHGAFFRRIIENAVFTVHKRNQTPILHRTLIHVLIHASTIDFVADNVLELAGIEFLVGLCRLVNQHRQIIRLDASRFQTVERRIECAHHLLRIAPNR